MIVELSNCVTETVRSKYWALVFNITELPNCEIAKFL